MKCDEVHQPEHPAFTQDSWWACEYPERPPDWWVLWSWECDQCLMHLAAAARRDPTGYSQEWDTDLTCTDSSQGETLRRIYEWRVENGPPVPHWLEAMFG